MAYTDLPQMRIELGLCFQCGATREGEGSNKWYCAVCNAKHMENVRKYRQRQKESPEEYTPEGMTARRKPPKEDRLRRGLCGRCVLPLTEEQAAGLTWCAECRARQRVKMDRQRRRYRIGYFYSDEKGTPTMQGSAVKLNGVATRSASIDYTAQRGLYQLLRIYWRTECFAAGGTDAAVVLSGQSRRARCDSVFGGGSGLPGARLST